MLTATQPVSSTFPAKIHFIWVGGPIPEHYLRSIQRLAIAAKKTGIEVSLWTDAQAHYERTAEKLAMSMPDNFRVRDIHELDTGMQRDSFYQQDKRYERFWSYINREMVGLKNLAAASDILRYEILRQEGGYYFDTDTEFYLDENTILKLDNVDYGFKKIGHLSREGAEGGNDIMAAVPGHAILERALLLVFERYRDLDTQGPLSQSIHQTMDDKRKLAEFMFHGRRPLTIELSGPGVMRDAMKSYMTTFLPPYPPLEKKWDKSPSAREFARKLAEFRIQLAAYEAQNPKRKLFFTGDRVLDIKVVSHSFRSNMAYA
ncbi:MAG: hypothetical protein A3E83_03205 [Gammaproteobacteria bacterium RIFCSPHIGHO2_12_FULL_41_20]|nr:MAG: hypothetical protein A3E83_03205 [Gammaproteobacteria bacterium RIFCSPHIGHO2_12_FULL_41_20]